MSFFTIRGYGYEITNFDVREAFDNTMKAAEHAGCARDTLERILALVSAGGAGSRFVAKSLARELE